MLADECPICKSQFITDEGTSVESEYARQIASCDECDARWESEFRLTGVYLLSVTKEV